MPFIKPMLASAMPKSLPTFPAGEWVAEEKLDGHRLIVEVAAPESNGLFEEEPENAVRAWGRYGIPRVLPPHLRRALARFPEGTYDGELLVPGQRSYGVTVIESFNDQVFHIFDVLELLGQNTMGQPYFTRRAYLTEIFSREAFQELNDHVRLVPATPIESFNQVALLANEVWERDGEGLILKRYKSVYQPNKRSKDFIKIKKLQTAVLTVIGFEPSKGEIVDRGAYAVVVLRDDEGNRTTVKTRNDGECAKLEHAAAVAASLRKPHPAIGRKLRIEYQERTPDGSYRHPRWDRWENE